MECVKVFLSLLDPVEAIPKRTLSVATSNGHLELVKLFLNDKRFSVDVTAIRSASTDNENKDNSVQIIKHLLAHDCDFAVDPNVMGSDFGLLKASKNGHLQKVLILLTKEPSETPERIKRSLDFALNSPHVSFDIVRALCLSGGSEIVNHSHIEEAVKSGRVDICKYLLDFSKIDMTTGNIPNAPFLIALDSGKLEMMQLILSDSYFIQFLEIQDYQNEKIMINYRPIKFNFQEPQFIQTFELALPHIDQTIFSSSIFMNSLLHTTVESGRNYLSFMKYLFEKFPFCRNYYLQHIPLRRDKIKIEGGVEERMQLLIFSVWPQLSLVYLMTGNEEGDLLHEIILLIMHFLILSYS
jgi:hypothetical protein